MGNSAYKNTLRLTNPVNDAALIGDMFKKAGFDAVDVKTDLNASEMRRALREFAGRVRDADMAVIYYAGHGIELDGTNYLIPTDAALETDADVYDEALPIDRVLVSIEPAKQLRLVILDACRDNPFAKTMKRTVASRAIGRGLAKVEPTSPNTMIAFAAKAGSTASDGDSRNSPFATALADHLPKPGLDLRKAFGFVRDDVLRSTANKQEPFVYGSLGGDDVPLVPAKPAATGPQANPQSELRRDYELALQLGTRDGWEAFLAQYPEGFYANLAKGQLNKIGAEETRAAAEQKARTAEQEKARLIAERAQKAEQEKAAAAAKAAEEARIAAEKKKEIEQARAEAAERERKVAEAAAAKALAEKQAAEKVKAELAAKQAAEKAEQAARPAADRQMPEAEQKLATLSPAPTSTLSAADLTKSVQSELRRVGCLSGAAEGDWSATSQRSLALFNKYAGTQFDA
ncbi:caspase family protein, partial [Bradyrhizobium diazoefficiens]